MMNANKESLWLKLVRFSYGIDNQLDERQLADVERVGNNAYVAFSGLEILTLFVSLIIMAKQIELAYYFLGLMTAIWLLVMALYTSIQLRRSGIYQKEILPQERPKAIKRILIKAVIEWGLIFIPTMVGAALGASLSTHAMVNVWSYWPQGLWFSFCVILGTTTFNLHQLKVVKEND